MKYKRTRNTERRGKYVPHRRLASYKFSSLPPARAEKLSRGAYNRLNEKTYETQGKREREYSKRSFGQDVVRNATHHPKRRSDTERDMT